jgi:Holliday junction resolvase RusA-like endonuclease
MLTLNVVGTPAPQGSKTAGINPRTGKVWMRESSAKVTPWRQDVQAAALGTLSSHDPILGPVRVSVTFYLARPRFHFRTGKNAHLLRDAAPLFPSTKPDIDKLLRSTLDGLGEAGVWRDDSQVVGVTAWKHYADARPLGAEITIESMGDE